MKRILIDLAVVLAVLVSWHAVAWFCTWRISWLWEWSPSSRFWLLFASTFAVFAVEQYMAAIRRLRSLGVDP